MNKDNVLIICALPIETQGQLSDFQTLYTGVGKVNAAIHLTKYLESNVRPELVINYGTAGSNVYDQGELLDCTKFVQRDMDATGLGFKKTQTPFEEMPPLILDYSEDITHNPIQKHTVCASGDSFVCVGDNTDTYEVIDMEAYALAKVCFYYQLPFIAFKYITDGADGAARKDWEDNLHDGIQVFLHRVLSVLF